MNISTVYFSPTGTTKKIVETIAASFGPSKDHNITLPKHRMNSLSFDKDSLVIIGLPVYAGRIPEIVDVYLKQIKGNGSKCILVAVYGNRDYDDALIEMKDIVVKNGFVPIAAGAFIGVHSYTQELATNRPDALDLSICKSFAEHIDLEATGELEVKGNRPYRERNVTEPLGPVVDDRCIKCGMCVINCPNDALKLSGLIRVDESKCIRCHACVRICPVESIYFDDRVKGIREWLLKNFSKRNEPELFYLK